MTLEEEDTGEVSGDGVTVSTLLTIVAQSGAVSSPPWGHHTTPKPDTSSCSIRSSCQPLLHNVAGLRYCSAKLN